MSTEAQPPTPPQHYAAGSRHGDTQQQSYGPPIAFNAQSSKRRRFRSSSLGEKASKFFSHLRPSRRPEKGHTIRTYLEDEDTHQEPVLDGQRWTRSLDTGRSNNKFPQTNPMNSRNWSSADGSEDKPDNKHKTTIKRIFRSFSLKHGRNDSDSQSKAEYIDESTKYQVAHHIPHTLTQHSQSLKSQTSNSTHAADHYEREVTSQQVCEDKIPRREERRRLKESGDYLGVQGVNPFTGVVDISESTSYQTSEDPQQVLAKARDMIEQLEISESTSYQTSEEAQRLLAKARSMIEQLEETMSNEPAMVTAPTSEEVRAGQRDCAARFEGQMRVDTVDQYSFTDSTPYAVAEQDAERDPFLDSVTSSRPVCPATCDRPACDLDSARREVVELEAEWQREWKEEALRRKEERIARNATKREEECDITPTPAEKSLAARRRARRAREDRLALFRLFPQPPRHLPLVDSVANSTGRVEHGHSSSAATAGDKLADTKQNIIPKKPVASPSYRVSESLADTKQNIIPRKPVAAPSRRVLESSADTIVHTTSALPLQSPPVARSSMEDNIANTQHIKVASNGHESTRSFLDNQRPPFNIPIRTSSLRRGPQQLSTSTSTITTTGCAPTTQQKREMEHYSVIKQAEKVGHCQMAVEDEKRMILAAIVFSIAGFVVAHI